MFSLQKKLFSGLIVFLVLLIYPQPAQAQSEFKTDYQAHYQVNLNGVTHTSFNISLTNKLSNIYASEFTLSIGSTKLENIKASNSSGPLDLEISKGSKTTNIRIPFNDKVLGKNKSQQFSLEFDSLDFANQLGHVWEISIPKLTQSENLETYQLTLSIPQSFGEPATISPLPQSKSKSNSHVIYRFNQQDLLQKGILATFGLHQYFNFSLNYHLENSNIYAIKTAIALPPDTSLQKMAYSTIEPPPDEITVDNDGNWLANYTLNPKQSVIINATGSAQINLNPRTDFYNPALSDPAIYLKPQPFWETDNPNITELAKELKTPENIYSYIVNNLIYDYGRLDQANTRFGAANALDNKDSAICMEFTDLFIALSRASGTPARAVNGFAYTTNSALRPLSLEKDVLHAWPEYYDQNQELWVPVDPTWGNTTGGIDFFNQFDLNHFTFSILGLDSNYPPPAGSYKLKNSESKDVVVDFGKPVDFIANSSLELNLPSSAIAGLPVKGQIIIKNTGNTAIYNQTVSLVSKHFKLPVDSWIIASLPPFSRQTIDIELPATHWLDNLSDVLSLTSDLSSLNQTLDLKPAYTLLILPQNIKYLYLSILGLSLLTFSLILLKKRRSKN